MTWATERLADIADIERKGIDPTGIVTGTSYLGLEHIESGGRILGSKVVTEGELASTKFRFSDEHILYGKLRPYLAKIALPDFAGICSTDILPVKPGPRIDKRYLAYFLRQPEMVEFASSRSTGANLPRLSPKALAEFQIPIPPLGEQKRIAKILDLADELLRKRQRAIDSLNQIEQAIFHEMFGDPKTNPKGLAIVSLGEIADFYSGNSLPKGEAYSGQKDGYLLLKVSDLNHIENQEVVSCAANWSSKPGTRAGTCPANALVFPKRGGAISTNKKRWLKRSAILDPNLMGVRPHEERLTMSFLKGWFQTFNLSDIASGSSVPQLNKKDLAPLRVALPPIDDQQRYASRIDELSRSRQKMVLAAERSGHLLSALQQKAFEGGL